MFFHKPNWVIVPIFKPARKAPNTKFSGMCVHRAYAIRPSPSMQKGVATTLQPGTFGPRWNRRVHPVFRATVLLHVRVVEIKLFWT